MTKSDVSEVLKDFKKIKKVKDSILLKLKLGLSYLFRAYEKAEKLAREKHIPSIIHVIEMTQPTGHSTSGSMRDIKVKRD